MNSGSNSIRSRRRRRKSVFKAAAAALAIVVLAAVLTLGLQRLAPPTALQRRQGPALDIALCLPDPIDPTFAGELVALKANLFKSRGLGVALHRADDTAACLKAAATEPDVITDVSPQQFLMARAGGVPLVAFAAGFLIPTVDFYTLYPSTVRTPFDFVGHRVGYQPEQDTAFVYQAMLDHLGISRSTIHETATTRDVTPLIEGRLDVLPGHVGVEAYALARKGIAYQALGPADYGLHIPGTVYVTSEQTIRRNSPAVGNFLRAVIAGWDLTYADEQNSAAWLSSYDPALLNSDMVRFRLDQQRTALRPFGGRIGEYDPSQWRLLQDVLMQQKLLREPVDLDAAVNFDILHDTYRAHVPDPPDNAAK